MWCSSAITGYLVIRLDPLKLKQENALKRLTLSEQLTIALHLFLHGCAVTALLNDRPDLSLFIFMVIFCLLSTFLNDDLQETEELDTDR
jgi:hypothetical protein